MALFRPSPSRCSCPALTPYGVLHDVCAAAADRRLSGASIGGGGGGAATGPAAEGREPAASPQQLAAELAAEQALADAQRDEIPHLSLQVI